MPAWLWGIASRRLASLARRQGGDELPLDAAGEGADPAAGPEQAVLGTDASARLRQAIARLPAEQRDAIVAVVSESKSIEQAAQAAEVPEGTLKAACTGPVRESARSCTH